MLLRDRVTWREPHRATRRDALRALRTSGVLRAGLWIRPTLIGAGLIAILIAWILWAFPGIALPWARMLIGLVIAPVFFLTASVTAIVVASLMPRYVEVRREWLQIDHGPSAVRIEPEQIDRLEVEQNGVGESRLVLEYRTRRGRNPKGSLAIAIAKSVDVKALQALLTHLRSQSSGSVHHSTSG